MSIEMSGICSNNGVSNTLTRKHILGAVDCISDDFPRKQFVSSFHGINCYRLVPCSEQRAANTLKGWARPVLLALMMVVLPAVASGQQVQATASGDASQYRIATRSILLDIVVVDKSGQLVKDLSQNDFSIVEDGVTQKIASFEAPHLSYGSYEIPSIMASRVPHVSSVTKPGDSEPLTILILDQLNTKFGDAAYARFSIKSFLQKYRTGFLQPTALLILRSSGRMEVAQDFTRDSSKVRSALDRVPATLPPAQAGASADTDADRFSISVAALLDIAAVTEQYPGRKNVVWIGSGFTKLTNLGIDNSQRLEQIRRASDRLMRAHVVFSYIDPGGLQVAQARDLTMDLETSELINIPLRVGDSPDFALAALAIQTGGHVSFGKNDVSAAISSSVMDGNSYYRLSYYPSNRDWNGAYRRIVVHLSRSGLTARTRAGYFAVGETFPLSKEQRLIRLARATNSRFAYTGLTLGVDSIRCFHNRGLARLRLTVLPNELERHPIAHDKMAFEITVLVADLSSNGRLTEHVTRDVEVAVDTPTLEAQPNQPVLITLDAPVQPGTTTVHIVAIDDHNGRTGSIEVNLRSLKGSSSSCK